MSVRIRAKTPIFPVKAVALVEAMVSFAPDKRETRLKLDDLDKATKPVALTVDFVVGQMATEAFPEGWVNGIPE